LDDLADLEKNSIDFYAQLRSLAQQQRASELRRGLPPGPEFYGLPPGGSGASQTKAPGSPPLAAPVVPHASGPRSVAPQPPAHPVTAPVQPVAPKPAETSSALEWTADPEEGPLLTTRPAARMP